jgi:hypothetical protein
VSITASAASQAAGRRRPQQRALEHAGAALAELLAHLARRAGERDDVEHAVRHRGGHGGPVARAPRGADRLGLGFEAVQADDGGVRPDRGVEGHDGGRVAPRLVGVVGHRAGHVAGDRDRVGAAGALRPARERRAHHLLDVLAREQRVPHEAVADGTGGLHHARVDARHVQRDVGAQRRCHRRGGPDDDAVEPSLVLDRPLVQKEQAPKERDELLHAACGVLAVEPVPVLLHAPRPGSEAEDQPAARERVEIARLDGENERRAPESVGDRAADGDPLGRGRHRRHRDRGRPVGELGRPH